MSRKSKPLIIIATGGTGGHVFPAQSLAEEMVTRGWRVKVWMDHRVKALARNFPPESQCDLIPSKPFSQKSLLAKIGVALILSWSLLIVLGKILGDRPTRLVGFGSYATFTPLLGGMLLGIPSIIHEQNGNMGIVNRLFSKRVKVVASGSHSPQFPSGTNWVFTGNPIRKEILSSLGHSYEFSSDQKINVLIIGGSQGARIFDQIIPDAISGLPDELLQRLSIHQQVREENLSEVESIYQGLGVDYEIKPFYENIPELMIKSQLIIARSGASSIAEIMAMGLPSILVPFAAASNDEQTINSKALEKAGAAIVLGENILKPELMSEAIVSILGNPEKARQMAAASKGLGVADAAKRLGDLVDNPEDGAKN